MILDAEIQTLKPDGTTRSIPFAESHTLPGDTPQIEVVLEHGELITHVLSPRLPIARRSHYLKVRDRESYEIHSHFHSPPLQKGRKQHHMTCKIIGSEGCGIRRQLCCKSLTMRESCAESH